MTLSPIPTEEYVESVLPQTHALWGGHRDFGRYVADFRAVADSAYGRRRRFTLGLRVDGRIAASCKRYDRDLRWGRKTLRATGIGAVFTSQHVRGRGYATALLGALLDDERTAGRDLAFLFSDIHPAFYERLGFIRLPSRLVAVRAGSLDGSHSGAVPLEAHDWPAVRRCFDALDAERPWSLKRTPLVWAWMRWLWSALPSPRSQPVQLVVREDRRVLAYVVGRRVLADDSFVIDDFGFAGEEGRARVPALLRTAAGDLGRVTGWLPPALARDALPRGAVRRRRDSIAMLVPLSAPARAWWRSLGDEIVTSRADPFWSADHV